MSKRTLDIVRLMTHSFAQGAASRPTTCFKYPPDIKLRQALALRADAMSGIFCVHPELITCDVEIMGTGRSGTVVQLNTTPPRRFKVFKPITREAYESEVEHALLMQKLIPDNAVGFIAASRIIGGRGVAELAWCLPAVDMYYAAQFKSLGCHHMVSALDAMLAMHGVGYLHNDIKPENFLVVRDHAKLIDFGCTRVIGDAILGGTWQFMHPRVSRSTRTERTVSTDVYSFAVTTLVSLDDTIANAHRRTLAEAAKAYVSDTPMHRALAVAHTMVEWAHCNQSLEYDSGELARLRAALYDCVECV